jgi:staphylococcal nuclease domain-containing protein 1
MMSANSKSPVLLPPKGTARIKSVMSGDTVILAGKPSAPGQPAPSVIFTLEGVSAPR